MPSLLLMERAGAGVVQFIYDRFKPLSRKGIAVLCGRGNNGGDGFVIARMLREKGLDPKVLLFGEPGQLKGDAAVNYERLAGSGKPETIRDLVAWREIRPGLSDTKLFVDALMGTGLTKPLSGLLMEIVSDLNRSFPAARRVSVDLPSGASADSGDLPGEAVHADASVTFTAPKYAHIFPPACELAGEWHVVDIGTPREAVEDNPELFLRLTTRAEFDWLGGPRKLDSHKGAYGHVLILAGSVGKTGAAAMAAKAALRSGAGLVTVGTPKTALPVIASLGMEWMTEPLPESEAGAASLDLLKDGQLDRIIEGKSVVALGPGMGNLSETAELIRQAVNHIPLPLVLDADGLNAFGGRLNEMLTGDRVRILTPHPGEMARLTGMSIPEIQKRRVDVAREFAMGHSVYLVLKGARTLVASPTGDVAVNPTGNPGMATAGTGDCLTGLIAGLLAQYPNRPPADVIAAAVYVHGLAGDLAAGGLGQRPMIAGDLLNSLPEAFLAIAKPEQENGIL